jgi:hypothetical protein
MLTVTERQCSLYLALCISGAKLSPNLLIHLSLSLVGISIGLSLSVESRIGFGMLCGGCTAPAHEDWTAMYACSNLPAPVGVMNEHANR